MVLKPQLVWSRNHTANEKKPYKVLIILEFYFSGAVGNGGSDDGIPGSYLYWWYWLFTALWSVYVVWNCCSVHSYFDTCLFVQYMFIKI